MKLRNLFMAAVLSASLGSAGNTVVMAQAVNTPQEIQTVSISEKAPVTMLSVSLPQAGNRNNIVAVGIGVIILAAAGVLIFTGRKGKGGRR